MTTWVEVAGRRIKLYGVGSSDALTQSVNVYTAALLKTLFDARDRLLEFQLDIQVDLGDFESRRNLTGPGTDFPECGPDVVAGADPRRPHRRREAKHISKRLSDLNSFSRFFFSLVTQAYKENPR
jgi:hypothetical protein